MAKIKVILVKRDLRSWNPTQILTQQRNHQVIGKKEGVLTLQTPAGPLEYTGSIYQMVGYNPHAANEEDMFLPISQDQWHLCSKFIPRDASHNLVVGLSDKGKLHDMQWQNAVLNENGEYELFKRVVSV